MFRLGQHLESNDLKTGCLAFRLETLSVGYFSVMITLTGILYHGRCLVWTSNVFLTWPAQNHDARLNIANARLQRESNMTN